MKIIRALMVLVAFFCLGLVSIAQNSVTDTVDIEPTVPQNLSIGDLAIVKMISQVTMVSIECTAASAAQPFRAEVDVSGFDGVLELSKMIRGVRIKLKVTNPDDVIYTSAFLKDKYGQNLFYSYTSFRLDKVYDKDGNVSYQKPAWAVNMYFSPEDFKIKFPEVQSAKIIDNNGNENELLVMDDQIVMPGWSIYGNYRHVVVKTSNAEYLYDAKTGQKLNPQFLTANSEDIYVDGVRLVSLDGNQLSLELYPEWNYSPWIETDFGTDQIYLNIRSVWGYEPIAVWVTNLDDLRSGESPKILQYHDGMKINGTGTVYLYFEFPGWLYGVDQGEGKG